MLIAGAAHVGRLAAAVPELAGASAGALASVLEVSADWVPSGLDFGLALSPLRPPPSGRVAFSPPLLVVPSVRCSYSVRLSRSSVWSADLAGGRASAALVLPAPPPG